MDKPAKVFLQALLETQSPSGSECAASKVFASRIADAADSVVVDHMGNTVATLSPTESRGKVMLAAHIDEVGLIVRYIDDRGFIYFSPVGAVDATVLPGKRVTFIAPNGISIFGVIGKQPFQVLDQRSREKAVASDDLFIDIGAPSKKHCLDLISVGDVCTVDQAVRFLPSNLIAARGLDNRLGVYVVAETLRILSRRRRQLKFELVDEAAPRLPRSACRQRGRVLWILRCASQPQNRLQLSTTYCVEV